MVYAREPKESSNSQKTLWESSPSKKQKSESSYYTHAPKSLDLEAQTFQKNSNEAKILEDKEKSGNLTQEEKERLDKLREEISAYQQHRLPKYDNKWYERELERLNKLKSQEKDKVSQNIPIQKQQNSPINQRQKLEELINQLNLQKEEEARNQIIEDTKQKYTFLINYTPSIIKSMSSDGVEEQERHQSELTLDKSHDKNNLTDDNQSKSRVKIDTTIAVTQAQASYQRKTPLMQKKTEWEELLNKYLNFQKLVQPYESELIELWNSLEKKSPKVYANILNKSEEIEKLFDVYDGLTTNFDGKEDGRSRKVDRLTIIYALMAEQFPQANKIISGETTQIRQQQRQSLMDLGEATAFRKPRLDNFYQGKDDSTNSFGGIRDEETRSKVDANALEIYERVTKHDIPWSYNDSLSSKAGQDLYQACKDAALLLMFKEASEIIGGTAAQRSSLNELFNSLPQKNTQDNPNAASQELIINRAYSIFQAITNKNKPESKTDQELIITLRNAILIEWNVKNARNIEKIPYRQQTNNDASDLDKVYVNQFIELITANAKARLKENRALIQQERQKYSGADPQNQKYWFRLRQIIEKDKQLGLIQNKLEEQRRKANTVINATQNPQLYGVGDITLIENMVKQASEQLDLLNSQIGEIQKVRKTLRVNYPALAVLKTETIEPGTSNEVIFNDISQGFQSIQNAIADVAIRLDNNSIPLHKLGPVVNDTLRQMSVDPQKYDKDPKSKAILNYLQSEKEKDEQIQLLGAFGSLGLAISSLFFAGGTAILLRIAGALSGLGAAAYEVEQADDLYTASKASVASGQPLVDDPEEARFNLILSWVNLLISSLDVGGNLTEGAAFFKATSKAGRAVRMHDAGVLALLDSSEIADFQKAIQLAPTSVNGLKPKQLSPELEVLQQKLIQRLGEEKGKETFEQAYLLFQRIELPPAKISELNGFKDVLSIDLRDKVPVQVNSSLNGYTVKVHYLMLDGLVNEFYVEVGPQVTASLIREHVPTIKLMQRYAGSAGRVRVMREQLIRWIAGNGEPKVGTLAWEAKFEIEKYQRMINARTEKLASLSLQDRIDGLLEIDDLNSQLAEFERVLSQMDEDPGFGFVAAGGRTKNARVEAAATKFYKLEAPKDHFYYQNNSDELPYQLAGGEYEIKLIGKVKKDEKIFAKNKEYAIVQKGKRPTNWASKKTELAKRFSKPVSFKKLEDALAQLGLTNEDMGAIRRWSDVIEELENQTQNPNLVNELTAKLSNDFREQQYDDFRYLLRAKIVDFLSRQTGNQRQELLQRFLKLTLDTDPKSKGELFSAFRRETQGGSFAQIKKRDLRVDNPNLDTQRSADDAVTLKSNIRNGPPAGNYLVEDKAGPGAFKQDQAQDYSSTLNQGNGKLKTKDGKYYDGVIYFFDTQASAEKAMVKIKNLNNNIHVAYYDDQGTIVWIR